MNIRIRGKEFNVRKQSFIMIVASIGAIAISALSLNLFLELAYPLLITVVWVCFWIGAVAGFFMTFYVVWVAEEIGPFSTIWFTIMLYGCYAALCNFGAAIIVVPIATVYSLFNPPYFPLVEGWIGMGIISVFTQWLSWVVCLVVLFVNILIDDPPIITKQMTAA